jgi:hypothetical protein
MQRAAAIAGAFVLFMLLGPWVLLLALASLVVPRVRAWLRPERPWRVASITAGVLVLVSGLVVLIPDGWLPIPPGPGLLVAPDYLGRAAVDRPLTGVDVPQHPHLARNGASSMHDDAWASDAYTWAGPSGDRPEIDTAWYGVEECATLAFDSHDRIVALCGDVRGPTLRVLDPDSMRPLVSKDLPDRVSVDDTMPWENLCGGAYFYLDEHDRAVVGTTDRRVLVIGTSDADGDPDLTIQRTYDVHDAVPDDDCLIALMPDWDGRIWFATRHGTVGAIDPATGKAAVTDLGAEIANSLAVDQQGVYAVTVEALYRLSADRSGKPVVDWTAAYDRGSEHKPGQLSQGSGTTPTLLADGLVAITDNADPRMNVVFYRRDSGEKVCEAPVFGEDASASDNSLVAVGAAGVVVENNHGYSSPLSTVLGRATDPGLARVDVVDGTCRVTWTNDEVVAPTSVAKVSLANGLVYAYTKRSSWWGVGAWYLTALDARTGQHVFSVRTGTGTLMNNHYAAITLAPDGSAYVATLGGMVRVHDRE